MFYLLAKAGFKVALHEQHQVGERVVCGELVPKPCEIEDLIPDKAPLYEAFNLMSSLKVWLCEIKEMEVYLNERFWTSFGFQGYVMDKSLFLKNLVQMGVDEGGKLFERSRFQSLTKHPTLKAKFNDNVENLDFIIAADGYPSSVAKAANLESGYTLNDWALCVNQRMFNVNVNEQAVKIYFSAKVAPGGFAWIIPRGGKCANVGLGVRMKYVKEGFNVLTSLRKLQRELHELKNAKPLTPPQLKTIPVGGYVKNLLSSSIVLVGDAAGTVVPIDGAGIIPAMLSSKAALNSLIFKRGAYRSFLDRYLGSMIENGLAYRKLGEKLIYSKLGSKLVKALATSNLIEKILKAKDTWTLWLSKPFSAT